MTQAHPLQWPIGWPRTRPTARKFGRFSTKHHRNGYSASQDISIAQAVGRVYEEISRFTPSGKGWRIDPDDVVISTNLQVRLDGKPRSSQKAPTDPGVAVYFELDGASKVIPCDRYTKVEQNIAAVAATLEALRALERHGSGIMERAFTGFEALPDLTRSDIPWYEVLEVDPNAPPDIIKAQYQRQRSKWHPDRHGGDASEFDQVQQAWREFTRQIAEA